MENLGKPTAQSTTYHLPPTTYRQPTNYHLYSRVAFLIPVNKGGQEGQEGQERQERQKALSFLIFLFFLSGARAR